MTVLRGRVNSTNTLETWRCIVPELRYLTVFDLIGIRTCLSTNFFFFLLCPSIYTPPYLLFALVSVGVKPSVAATGRVGEGARDAGRNAACGN